MEELDLLTEVKKRIGVTGAYQDPVLTGFIEDVKAYMLGAGVTEETLASSESVGAIFRGVSDLWNYGSGDGNFSTFFYERVIQLSYKGGDANV